VDAAIDGELLRLLQRHPSWATAPEIEPSPAALTQYADYLTAKIATYDARIGAASKDPGLSRQRAELGDTLQQVNAMRKQGAFGFDAGTPLYRALRSREIREELTGLQRRQQELTEELAQLGAAY
jgi:hypothetical protein